MQCIALASGSSGNCIYLEGSGSALLIDAGLSKREFLSRLGQAGGNPGLVSAILVTHEHTDHILGLEAIARHLDVPVYATGGTLYEFLAKRRTRSVPVRAVRCEYQEEHEIGDFTIELFETSHDAREPCGFRIRENGVSIGCCTDTGVITAQVRQTLGRCDAVILESNHCPDMLAQGPYPEVLKRRIRGRRGHLSNRDASSCLSHLCTDIQQVMLAHLSEVNNTPEKAIGAARGAVGLYRDQVELTLATNPGSPAGWPHRIRL